MHKKRLLAIIIVTIFFSVSFNSVSALNIKSNCVIEASDAKIWTFMIYLDGDNNIQNKLKNEIFHHLESVGSTDDMNIIVQFDALDLFDGIHRYYVTYDKDKYEINSEVILELSEKSMGNPNTLYDFVIWTCENYPAENYCLILTDHGNGWRSGFLVDETNDDYLSMSELKIAMNNIKFKRGRNLDVVVFEACFMGMAEVYYQIRNCVDIFFGSADIIIDHGLPYHMILSDFKNNPHLSASDLISIIIEQYSNYYPLQMAMAGFKADDFVEKVIDDALDDFALALNNVFSEYKSEIMDAIEYTTSYNPYENYITNYKDLYDFAHEISIRIFDSQVKRAAQDLMNEINKCTIDEGHKHKSDSHGFSIYLPTSKNDYDSTYEDLDICKNTHWDEFVKKCLSKNRNHSYKMFKNNIFQNLFEKILPNLIKDKVLY